MCGTCGCSDPKNAVTVTDLETGSASILRQRADMTSPMTDEGEHKPGHGHHHHQHEHEHHHGHDHQHHHDESVPHVHGPNGEVITLEQAVLAKNDQIAIRNRGWFEDAASWHSISLVRPAQVRRNYSNARSVTWATSYRSASSRATR